MRRFPEVPGFGYSKLPLAALEATLPPSGCVLHDLGPASDPAYSVLALSHGPLDGSRPVIWIDANIHGLQEWRTCYWVRGFMERIADPEVVTTGARVMLTRLHTEFSFFAPITLNPYGYVHNVRWNANGVDLNRNFEDPSWEGHDPEPGWGSKGSTPFSEVEAQYVRDGVLAYKPALYVNTHTWGSRQGSTTYVPPHPNRGYLHMVQDFSRSMKVTLYRDDNFWSDPVPRPLSSAWASRQSDSRGELMISTTFESGGGMPEEEQARVGMTGLLLLSWYARERLRSGKIKLWR